LTFLDFKNCLALIMFYHKKIIVVIALVLLAGTSFCQVDSLPSKKRKSSYLDTNYVVRYKDRLVVSLYQSTRNYKFDMSPIGLKDSSGADLIKYSTNSNLGTGIGFDYDKISFSIGRSTPGTEKEIRQKGKTSSFNLAFSLNGKRHRIETFYRSYMGFYDSNYGKFGYQANDTNIIHYQNPRMSVKEFRTKFFWYFNKKRRFSYAAAYSNTQRQLKSAGTFLVAANVYGLVVKSDTGLIPYPSRPFYPESPDLIRVRSIGFSFKPGFSYNLVLFKRLFANVTFLWGPELQFRKFSDTDRGDKKSAAFGFSEAEFRGSIGYNGKYLYFYYFLMSDLNRISTKTIFIDKTLIYQGGVIGYRFKFNNKFSKWLQANKYYNMI